MHRQPPRGRGAQSNRTPRFESLARESVDDGWPQDDEPPARLQTTVTEDHSRTVISYNQSPDVPFDRAINPYRGCEHGCVYCFARPSHAWLGLSPGLDFETRLTCKPHAASILREELAKPGYRPATLSLGANTDPYQPVERRLKITRAVLEVLAQCKHPVGVVTKSALVERDLGLLTEMADQGLASVAVSITTLDAKLARRMEPRASAPRRRLETVRILAAAGIPVIVLVAPIIPFLNDQELETILDRVAELGARHAGYVMLRLPLEIADLFREWLEQYYPEREARVFARIRDMRGGKDYDARFGQRMRGQGPFADIIAKRFATRCAALGLSERPALTTHLFRPPAHDERQYTLFD